MRRATALRRELPTAFRIPYRAHVSPHVVRTDAGEYAQVFKLDGGSFETADDDVLNNWHERLNVLWRGVAAPNVALWTHVIRRRERARAAEGRHEDDFAERLTARYSERLSSETLMINELYLAVVYRPVVGAAPSLLSRL
jgi:type IV secretion system protein VirB4